jgi:hypothetical protein
MTAFEMLTKILNWDGWNGISAIMFGATAVLAFIGNKNTQKSVEQQSKIALFRERNKLHDELKTLFHKIMLQVADYDVKNENSIFTVMEKSKTLHALKAIPITTETKLLSVIDESTFHEIRHIKDKLEQLFMKNAKKYMLERLEKIEKQILTLYLMRDFESKLNHKWKSSYNSFISNKTEAHKNHEEQAFGELKIEWEKLVQIINETGYMKIGEKYITRSNGSFIQNILEINNKFKKEARLV